MTTRTRLYSEQDLIRLIPADMNRLTSITHVQIFRIYGIYGIYVCSDDTGTSRSFPPWDYFGPAVTTPHLVLMHYLLSTLDDKFAMGYLISSHNVREFLLLENFMSCNTVCKWTSGYCSSIDDECHPGHTPRRYRYRFDSEM